MTIKRGEEWGRRITAPDEFAVLSSDAELAGHPRDVPAAVTAGDLWCALGRPRRVAPGDECTEVSIDAMEVTVTRGNGSVFTTRAASSVEVGGWFSREGYVAVLNTGFLRGLNLTPRSHPNDGRIEVFEIDRKASFMQRLLIRRRGGTGSHLPHPDVAISAVQSARLERASRGRTLRIDGHKMRSWRSVSIDSAPDHWRLLL